MAAVRHNALLRNGATTWMNRVLAKIWHPHQGLWNWDLVTALTNDPMAAKPPKSRISWMLIWIDSCILAARVLHRRMTRSFASGALFGKVRKGEAKVTYIDIGTHVAAKELTLMREHVLPGTSTDFRCIGIEANEASCGKVAERFAGDGRVVLIHAAACRDIPESGHVELYLHGDGHGDSLYRANKSSIAVPAIKVSDLVKAEAEDPDRIILLRMNIEGAELDVLKDLDENGVLDRIDGFYGMWDDLSKIDPELDRELIAFMEGHGLRTLTFNERDFISRFRVRVIAYDIVTSIVCAGRRRW